MLLVATTAILARQVHAEGGQYQQKEQSDRQEAPSSQGTSSQESSSQESSGKETPVTQESSQEKPPEPAQGTSTQGENHNSNEEGRDGVWNFRNDFKDDGHAQNTITTNLPDHATNVDDTINSTVTLNETNTVANAATDATADTDNGTTTVNTTRAGIPRQGKKEPEPQKDITKKRALQPINFTVPPVQSTPSTDSVQEDIQVNINENHGFFASFLSWLGLIS